MTDVFGEDRAERVVRRLNEAFLATSPGDYFRARAQAVVQLGDAFESASQPAGCGSFTAEVLARLPGWSVAPVDDPADEERRRAVLTVESFMLAHHAGESLLRHFFAQLSAGPLRPPWLVLSAQRADFRDRVREMLDRADDELLREVTHVFVGDRAAAVAAVGDNAVAAHLGHATAWLRHCARWHLDNSNGYNAAKHGLGTLPGSQTVAFVPEPERGQPVQEHVLLAGATLDTLESEGKGTQRRWYRVLRTVDPAGLVATVLVAADLLDTLWAVSRARHLGDGAAVGLHDRPSPRDVLSGHAAEWGVLKIPLTALPLKDAQAHEVMRRMTPDLSDEEAASTTGEPTA